MVRRFLSVSKKLKILDDAESSPNLSATARMHKVDPNQIRRWRANVHKLIEKQAKNPKALTVHCGEKAHYPELENSVFEWFQNQRKNGFAVSTSNLICKALQIHPNFKDGNRKRLCWWAHKFLQRFSLVFRRPTRVSQHTPEQAEETRAAFAQSTMTLVRMNGISDSMFVNMDETAVYFDAHHCSTIHERGAKTVSVRRGSSENKRCTVCITVAADGRKLPLFVIFKGAVNGRISQNLHHILPHGIFGCTQPKGWMDNRVMELWKEKVWKPYIEGVANTALLLDKMESHIHPSFIDSVGELGTRVIEIPGGFTSVCQPCDVGIMKPFKMRLIDLCEQWKITEYARMGGVGKIPTPGRAQVLLWLDAIWKDFPAEIIQNSFKKCGFTNDVDIDIDVALDFV